MSKPIEAELVETRTVPVSTRSTGGVLARTDQAVNIYVAQQAETTASGGGGGKGNGEAILIMGILSMIAVGFVWVANAVNSAKAQGIAEGKAEAALTEEAARRFCESLGR